MVAERAIYFCLKIPTEHQQVCQYYSDENARWPHRVLPLVSHAYVAEYALRALLRFKNGLPKNRNPQSPRNALKCNVG